MTDVLRVITRLNVGGPARHVIRISAPLARRGWNTVLVTGTSDPGEGDLVDEARAAGIDVRVVPQLGRSIDPLRDLAALRALRALVQELRPAIVHTHTAKAGVIGRMAALSVRPARRPLLVHTYHGHVLDGYFSRAVSATFARVEAGLARRTDRLVAVSERVRQELVERHRVGRREQYAVVPPGVDGLRTQPDPRGGRALRERLGLGPDDVLVGAVGRLAPVKDPQLLLATWELLRSRHPRARLLIVGDGPLAAAVDGRLASLPGVVRLPMQRELGAVYAALDLLAMSSRREGLPQVVVEALRAGVPVVSTAVGGVPELVRERIDGRLVPGRPAALAAALDELMGDAALRRAYGRAAAARPWAAHEPESVAACLAAEYAALRAPDVGDDPAVASGSSAGHPALSCTSSS